LQKHVWDSGSISATFLLSILDGDEWSTSWPLGMNLWYPLYRRLGGPLELVCYTEVRTNLLHPLGLKP
jgi:hypothetical protein